MASKTLSMATESFIAGPRIDPRPREGEIVFDRIGGRVEPECLGDAECRPHVRYGESRRISSARFDFPPFSAWHEDCAFPRLPQKAEGIPAGREHMGIERYDEPGRIHASPAARIDRVLAHHPPEIEEKPLAGRTLQGVGEKVGPELASPEIPDPPREIARRRPNIVSAGIMLAEKSLEASPILRERGGFPRAGRSYRPGT